MKVNYYSGVGSRETPAAVGVAMVQVASFLEEEGYILRSGGAPGADSFFEAGVTNPEAKHIYLPKAGMFGNDSKLIGVCEQALEIAAQIHPMWSRCSPIAKKLHARNVYQVLGKDLKTPSKFLLCWTANGDASGGTRTAIKLADKHDIPVLNFGKLKTMKYMDAFENFYMFVG